MCVGQAEGEVKGTNAMYRGGMFSSLLGCIPYLRVSYI